VQGSYGFGVEGVDEAYRLIREYITRERDSLGGDLRHADKVEGDPAKRYYVAVLDLEKCFDMVDTARLYDMVVNLLKEKDRADSMQQHTGTDK
jgi:hypothetical protein